MKEKISVKVSKRYQVVLPGIAREQLNIEAGDRLLVDVQDGVMVLIPEPDNYVERLEGLHHEIWADVDTTDYLKQERAAWTPSGND